MSNGADPGLVFQSDAAATAGPGTHVLIIGVGEYAHGKNRGASTVGGDLRQLTSPPISARAMADWFVGSFKNQSRPLTSVSVLISEENPRAYTPPQGAGAAPTQPPAATLANVKKATRAWADRLKSHQDNMAVFYFCGHGASLGQRAALLLEDFGEPGMDFEGAIDVEVLRGTMKNSPAIRQVYLLDCCRTGADDFYKHESMIGSRVVSESAFNRGHDRSSEQFVLFPTVDGEEAFGIKDQISVFSHSMIDAMSFAAADVSTGDWKTTTGKLLSEVDRLVSHRVPEQLRQRSKPNALDATSFEFNEIDEPTVTRSFVTLSDLQHWSDAVEFECVDAERHETPLKQRGSASSTETCCSFELKEGRWLFSGKLPTTAPTIKEREQTLRIPVAYVTLEVQS